MILAFNSLSDVPPKMFQENRGKRMGFISRYGDRTSHHPAVDMVCAPCSKAATLVPVTKDTQGLPARTDSDAYRHLPICVYCVTVI